MKERITYLITKYLHRSASKEEEEELFSILSDESHQHEVQHILLALMRSGEEEELAEEGVWDDVFDRIVSPGTSIVEEKKTKPLRLRKMMNYAAIFLVATCCTVVTFYLVKKDRAANDRTAMAYLEDRIVPGRDKAVLVLSDNSHIDLEEPNTTVDLTLENVYEHSHDQLTYARMHHKEAGNGMREVYHKIIVPKGGQYRVRLSDGTWVWLNADTELRYPVAFAEGERKVELYGEAFFDVSKDEGRPFNVHVNGRKHIQVLGTQFNLKAYPDEGKTKTSLYQGAVAVFGQGKEFLLKPGQQSVAHNATGHVSIRMLKSDDDMAWRNGYFVFDRENIQDIMRTIGRWYDVEILYEGKPVDELFRGTISRFEDVREVLNMIELTDIVSFKIEGRRIKVIKR